VELYEAIQARDKQVVSELLTADPALVEASIASRDRPLHIAVSTRDVQIVALMLERGSDLNSKGFEGRTALHYAVESADEDVVEQLIGAGADVNAVDDHGMSILAYATKSFANPVGEDMEEGRIFKRLIEKGAIYDLISAGLRTDLRRIKEIIRTNPDAVPQLEEPELLFNGVIFQHWGSEDDKIETLRFLLQHGLKMSEEQIQVAIQSCDEPYQRPKVALYLQQLSYESNEN
jgi:Ankyrin repeats (3 copies)